MILVIVLEKKLLFMRLGTVGACLHKLAACWKRLRKKCLSTHRLIS